MKRLDVWPRPEYYNTNLSTDAHAPTLRAFRTEVRRLRHADHADGPQ